MSGPYWTSSAHDRVRECPASAALPRVDRTTSGNTFGSVVHRFLELCGKDGRDAAIAATPEEHRAGVEGLPVELYPTHLTAEVAVAYDVLADRGRVLATGQGRDYRGVQDTEVCGTADVVGLDGDRVVVVDYKPPWMPLPAPGMSGQLRLLALALARAHGLVEARVAWCRYTDEAPRWEHAELSPLDLDDFADELRETWTAVVRARARVAAGKEPDVHTGPWCRYCPAIASCPAHRLLVLELAYGRGPDVSHEPMTPVTAGTAWEQLQRARRALDAIEAAVRSYAEQEAIVLPDGRRLGYVDEPGHEEVIDVAAAFLVVTELYGEAAALQAIRPSTNKAELRRALSAVAKATGRPLAHLERALHARLRAAGALARGEARRVLRVLDE